MKHLPAAGGIVVLIASGLAHGLLTDRWTASEAVAASVARLGRVPIDVGSWKGQSLELDRAQLTIGGIAGYLTRNYVNAANGTEVTVLIVTGRSGPISLHPPEVCYAGRGYEMTAQARREVGPIPGVAPATFSVGDLVKTDGLQADRLKIYWAWKADGPWMSPGDPRMTFARHPALYKMYVIRKMVEGEKEAHADACVEFLHEFLPACEQALAPTAREPSA
jgi:hypothetical protein